MIVQFRKRDAFRIAIKLFVQLFVGHMHNLRVRVDKQNLELRVFSHLSISRADSRAHIFVGQAIYSNHFVARLLTAFEHDRMPREFQLLGEKTDQRCIRLCFNRWCTDFDPNRAGVFAHNTVDFGVGNNMNAEDRHSAESIRTEVKLLDGFCRPMP